VPEESNVALSVTVKRPLTDMTDLQGESLP
jgi:hypothetical protein